MKTGIHPEYYAEARVICSCGHSYVTGATKPELRIEICSSCHPFFTSVSSASSILRVASSGSCAGSTYSSFRNNLKRMSRTAIRGTKGWDHRRSHSFSLCEHMTTQQRATYGGQAVLEGVMIRGQTHMAVAVRRPNGAIATQLRPLSTLYTGTLRRLPLVRGVITLVETLSLGMRALSYSSSVSLEDPEADPDSEVESEELSKGALASMLLVSFGFAILLFFLLPLFASRPLEGAFGNDILSNVAEGAIRLAVFVAYIWVIGRMAEIRRVFMYHGAEHMTVHAQERGDPLVTEAIRKYSPAHPRCGTAFLLTVMVLAILVFVFVPREPLWWLVVSRIVFIPLIAAVAYEVIRFSGRYEDNPLVRLISAPNLLLQKLTTRWPDDDQIEVAVAAMETALEADREAVSQPS